ncbi:DUF3887 domain-containing protein [Cyanobium sp. N5-Cardenillas]|uniref:DUF3887 domain-containing protein n=1 Tax=Cyanobium sp. N5-Cardenillas TaxID=2823720 RepID=UPI0020CCFFE0|nr:DUF3887 domain-containing protein [Cyanobium sp. N5-Cardenillas]MCP9785086.1 DUF3887 domain-containing protein [Cyanobium sp. N5-Cardenillas]
MPRPQPRRALIGLTLLLSSLAVLAPRESWAQAVSLPVTTGQPSAALSEAQARSAAERILTTIRNGDAQARFNQFSPALQRVSSPSMVAATMKTQPRLLRWAIRSIQPGYDSSTVEATLFTAAGERDLLMVIDANGRIDGYHFDVTDQPAEKVVRDFITALASGHFISASSFLSPVMQEQIPQGQLQQKWLNLQRITGNFVRVKRINRAESTPDMRLVIVNTEFNRLTDNLFVTLDAQNQIIGVDFPTDPAPPSPPR